MPLISIIVPAFKVQGYLRQCLDSVLDQEFADFELIVVDDCSPDHSGEIADDVAAGDARVQVIHLERNVGLGRARNAGLARATGDFVWFLDSDDWIEPGVLGLIADRLQDRHGGAPLDMLVLDYNRANPLGPLHRSWAGREMRPVPEGEVFRAIDRPQILRVVHFAWNRVVRRQFLIDHGLDEFFEGWYEDISWSFPAMAKAERIGWLATPAINYRQRRGSITKSSGARHLEFFGQWAKAFERVGREDPLWEHVFARFVWHTLMVLENPTRLPDRAARRPFFAKGTEFYGRYAPKGGVSPQVAALHWERSKPQQARWLANGDFFAFERRHAMRWVKWTGVAVGKRAAKAPSRAARLALGWRLGLAGLGYYAAEAKRPVIEDLAVFDAYWGLGYTCNPAAIYERMREIAPQIKGVWLVREDRADAMPAGIPYVVRGTRDYYRTLARAKYFVSNVNFPNFVRKRPGTVHLATQHGTPLKSMGIDEQHFPSGADIDFEGILHRIDRWDYCLSSNPLSTEVWERAFPAGYQMLEYGYPRNDRLAKATPESVAKLRAELGLDPDDLVVLYTPTHRFHHDDAAPPLDAEALLEALGPRGRVLLRDHHLVTYTWEGHESGAQRPPIPDRVERAPGRIVDVSTHPRIEDLYLAADVLLVDYSSSMFDFAVLDKPIVVFAPDWDEYRTQRGVTFDLMEQRPGAVARTAEELRAVFVEHRYDDADARRRRAEFRVRFCPWDDGAAADRVVRKVFLGEEVSSPGDRFVPSSAS